MRGLRDGERARLERAHYAFLGAPLPVVAHIEAPEGARYAVLSRTHRRHTDTENGWRPDRVLYLDLGTGETFDSSAERFRTRFVTAEPYLHLLNEAPADVATRDGRDQRHTHREATRALQGGVPDSAQRAHLRALIAAIEAMRPDLAGYHGAIPEEGA